METVTRFFDKAIMFCMTSVLLTSCLAEENLPHKGMTDDEIRICVKGIDEMTTRAGYDTYEDIAEMELIISGEDYECQKKMVLDNGEWVTDDKSILTWGLDKSKEVKVAALVPHTEDINNESVTLTVLSDQSTEENIKASDYLISVQKVVPETLEDNTIELNFRHLMSRIVFKVKAGDDYVSPESLHISGAVLTGICDLSAEYPTVVPDEDTEKTEISFYGTGNPENGGEAVIIPQPSSGITVQFIFEGRSYTWTPAEGQTFEGGSSYTVTVCTENAVTGKVSGKTMQNRY